LADTRLLLNEQARAAISWPFLVVLVFWLAVLFTGFGLFAEPNTSIAVKLLLGAISVAGAILLNLELEPTAHRGHADSIGPIRNA
jgi:hypothetical protein